MHQVKQIYNPLIWTYLPYRTLHLLSDDCFYDDCKAELDEVSMPQISAETVKLSYSGKLSLLPYQWLE